ncbi:MAG: hypothetical protein ABL863_05115 [Nitrosomonas sp.]
MNLSPADEKTILLAVSLLICTATVSIAWVAPATTKTLERETVLALIYEDDPDEGGQIERSNA